MNEDASKLDLLILSYCHFAVMPVPQLVRRDVNELLNMPHHCLGSDSFFQKLLALVERGWLEVYYGPRLRLPIAELQRLRESGWVETDDSPDVILDRRCGFQKLQEAWHSTPSQRGHLRLGLTLEGGLQWERFAQPRWYLFVDDRGRTVIDGRAHLIMRARTRRMAFFVSELLKRRGWWLRPQPIHSISPLEMWDAFYWKRFPRGYQIQIDLQIEPESFNAEAYNEGFGDMENGAANIINYASSLWDLEFRSRLDDLRFRTSRR
jgi:hypothetical protein